MRYFAYIVLFEDLVVMMAGIAWVFLSSFSSHFPWGEVIEFIFFLFSFIENMTRSHLISVPQAPAFSALIISRALPFIQPLSCITALSLFLPWFTMLNCLSFMQNFYICFLSSLLPCSYDLNCSEAERNAIKTQKRYTTTCQGSMLS